MTTEKSADEAVLESVFSSSRDRSAEPAAPVETQEAKAEPPSQPDTPKGEPEKVATEAEVKAKGYRDPENGRFVPLGELQSEREKRQEAQKSRDEEARLRQEAEVNARVYKAQIEELQRRSQAPQQPQRQMPQRPNPQEDPFGAIQYDMAMLQHARQQDQLTRIMERANDSEGRAREKFGDKPVDEALQAAIAAGINQQFLQTQNPYGELMKWHRREQTLARVGTDPDAYEKSIEERVRTKVLEELKAGKTSVTGQQAQPQTFPGSLVDATASGAQGAQSISDEALLGGIFASNRAKRR